MRREIEDLVTAVTDMKIVIDAVIADHATLIERINAAVIGSDLSAVANIVVDLKAQTDRLRGIIAPSIDAPAA